MILTATHEVHDREIYFTLLAEQKTIRRQAMITRAAISIAPVVIILV